MSVVQFLLAHGWKRRVGMWEHPRLGGTLHHWAIALLQQGQWMEIWIQKATVVMGEAEGLPVLAGTEHGILMSRLLCEVP